MADIVFDIDPSSGGNIPHAARSGKPLASGPSEARQPARRHEAQLGSANDSSGEPEDRLLVIGAPELEPRGAQLFIKRLVDVAGAGIGLVLLLPALLLIAALIRIESKGSPVFRQRRTGLNGAPFDILKFRSMYADGDGCSRTARLDDEGRITRVGRFLRKTNLDELPQLWNVLVGDMSLVGPRPHVPDMMAAGRPYDALVAGYNHRHLMRPGLTGLAQARGLRGPTANRWNAARRILCDIEYIRCFSLALDARIIARTIANEIKGGTGS